MNVILYSFVHKLNYIGKHITFLLKAQILSHSINTTDLLEPWAMINCLKPSTVMPLLKTPLTVGNLGSSLPKTRH